MSSHLCSVLLTSATGTTVISVPYKGTAPALADLVGGQIDLLCDQTTNTTGHITAGTVTAYALTAAERLPTLPDLPTTAEAGVPEVVAGRLARALRASRDAARGGRAAGDRPARGHRRSRRWWRRLRDLGGTTVAAEQATPQAHAAHLDAEIAKWAPILAAAGVQAN